MTHSRITPEDPSASALKQLIAGNQRYMAGKSRHPHQTLEDRQQVVDEQKPIAAILGCADSRVVPELLFDQGIGDIFTVRVAGNVVDDVVENSLEFAVEVLGVPLIVVLGHQNCGAIQATVSALTTDQDIANHPNSLIRAIAPAARGGDPIENAIRGNVSLSVDRLRDGAELSQHIYSGDLQIVGAYYRLDTGEVEFLEE